MNNTHARGAGLRQALLAGPILASADMSHTPIGLYWQGPIIGSYCLHRRLNLPKTNKESRVLSAENETQRRPVRYNKRQRVTEKATETGGSMEAKPIIVRTSELSSFKRCQARWWWGWVQGWDPNKTNDKLWFGSGIHVGLAKWYKKHFERGQDPRKTWLQFVQDENTYVKDNKGMPDEVEWISARDLGFAMLDHYLEEYGDDPAWDVIGTETPFQVQIQTPRIRGGYFIYVGTFDGAYRDEENNNALMLMEHKTSAGAPNFGYLEIADQPNGYFLVAEPSLRAQGLLGPDEHLDGIMYNYLRKTSPDDRPRNAQGQALNKDGSVSKRQDTQRLWRHPVWRSLGQRKAMKEAIINTVEQMQAIREGKIKIIKNPTMDCAWDCSFFQMCQLHESGEDWQEFRDAMFHRRDVYKDHRLAIKSAGNETL